MCGIAGSAGWSEQQGRDQVARMCQAMVHRGPDGHGLVCQGNVVLGHRRLKILDLSEAGRQPMRDASERFTLTFNGEIYNYRELRQALKLQGYSFVGTSDTEVLLAAYQHYGVDCLNRIEGMYAFAIHDARDGSLVLARDPLGIKPLYYHEQRGQLLFASELRGLLASQSIHESLDAVSLAQSLMMQAPLGSRTPFRHVRLLGPGETLRWTPQLSRRSRFWQFGKEASPTAPTREGLEQVSLRVVREHLQSDVPLAVLLSGGIDSSALLALASRETEGKVRAFTLGFTDPELDESNIARETAKKLQVDHTVVTVSAQDLLDYVDPFIKSIDIPTIDGFNVYAICKIVRDAGFVVLLSGQGGDEAFAGYGTFQQLPRLWQMIRILNYVPSAGRGLIASWTNRGHAIFGGRAKAAAILATARNRTDSYLLSRMLFPPAALRTVLQVDVCDETVRELAAFVESLESEWTDRDPVRTVAKLESTIYMHDTLLRASDINSMAHSVELRVPFVDRRICDYANRFPARERLDPRVKKPLLWQQVAPVLPEGIMTRNKSGFHLPVGKILAGPLRDSFHDLLNTESAFPSHIFRREAIRGYVKKLESQTQNIAYSHAMWGLYVLGSWLHAHGNSSRG